MLHLSIRATKVARLRLGLSMLGALVACSGDAGSIAGPSSVSSALASITVPSTAPGTVGNLVVAATSDTSATLTFTQVGDGLGGAASYAVRYAVSPLVWWLATSVSRGSCATPTAGTTAGSPLTCTVLGLTPNTAYQFEVVSFRGTLNLNAVFGGLSNVASGTTTLTSVASVAVTPATSSVTLGAGGVQFAAVLKSAGGNALTGPTVTWSSSNTAVATINASGLATTVAAGTATITATSGTASGTATLTVAAASAPGTVINLGVASTSDTSATLTFTQVGDGLGGAASYDVRYAVSPLKWWLAGSVSRGSCTTPLGGTTAGNFLTCTVFGLTPNTAYQFELVSFRGTLNLNAVFGAISNVASGTTTLTSVAPVASVAVTPATSSVTLGSGGVQFAAVLKSASGNVLTGQAVTWSSSNTAVATINASGLASTVAAGTATITATSGTASGTAALTVTAIPAPGTVSNLSVAATADTAATLTFTQVTDGAGGAASYDVRYAVSPLTWATATHATRGTCTTPVAGTTVGSALTCTVFGLTANTAYQFQVVAFRGTLNVNAVLGGLSNVASATTARTSVASVAVTRPAPRRSRRPSAVGAVPPRRPSVRLPVTFPNQTSAQQFIFEVGRSRGAIEEAGSDGAGYYLWDNTTLNGANGGPAANEYSAYYQSTWFSVYGNGSTIEMPSAELIKLFYVGSTFNNMNSSGGFTQLYWAMQCVSVIATSPLTCSQFTLNLYNQNGDDQTFAQNLNTSKHIVVGQVHHLEMVLTTGTDQGANGTVDWWLDGVHIGTASNGKFLDHALTWGGASGTAGFTSFTFEPWWGGQGGPNKTRNDALYFGHTYISGIFLRSRQ